MNKLELIRFIGLWILGPTIIVLWLWLLLHMYPAFGKFVWSVFCDTQGKPAYGRIASWFALNAVILWVTHIVWKTEAIPDLKGPLLFVAGLFFIEKLPELVSAWKGNPLTSAVLTTPTQAPAETQKPTV